MPCKFLCCVVITVMLRKSNFEIPNRSISRLFRHPVSFQRQPRANMLISLPFYLEATSSHGANPTVQKHQAWWLSFHIMLFTKIFHDQKKKKNPSNNGARSEALNWRDTPLVAQDLTFPVFPAGRRQGAQMNRQPHLPKLKVHGYFGSSCLHVCHLFPARMYHNSSVSGYNCLCMHHWSSSIGRAA